MSDYIVLARSVNAFIMGPMPMVDSINVGLCMNSTVCMSGVYGQRNRTWLRFEGRVVLQNTDI